MDRPYCRISCRDRPQLAVRPRNLLSLSRIELVGGVSAPVEPMVDVQYGVEELYRLYAGDLVRFAATVVGSADAEDVVAAVFSQALHRNAFFSAQNQRAYLYRAVLNACNSHGRSQSRRRHRERRVLARPEALMVDGPGPDLSAALDSLSVKQRAVVHLTYWEDLDGAEVAKRLGISEGSVRKHLGRAKDKLRKLIP